MIYAGDAISTLIDTTYYKWLQFDCHDKATGKLIQLDIKRSEDNIPFKLLAVQPYAVQFTGNCVIFHYWR